MIKRIVLRGLLVSVLLSLLQSLAMAAEPSVHDVYTLAESGRVTEARQLMEQVLRDHPNSGKAHFVNAELLARENQITDSRRELANAERLSPGLPFAERKSVQSLRAKLGMTNGFSSGGARTNAPFPWGMVLLIGALIFAVVAIIRSYTQRAALNAGYSGNGYSAPAQPMSAPPYGAPYSGQPMGGGMGSGIMGGLVTGAAIGAGLVAGEALAHKFVDDPTSRDHPTPPDQSGWDNNSDMGGQDFGLNDTSSWDSGGGDIGGGDWG